MKFFRLKNLKSIRLSICPMRSVKSSNEESDVVKTFKKLAEMQNRFFHRVVKLENLNASEAYRILVCFD